MLNKSCDIPHNIMELEGDHFFEFIKQYSGEKVANLLEFQDISNVHCLLACDDPLEILSLDSNDLLDLKKKTCIKLNNNSFVVLPGIKSKMNLLKNAIMKKYYQLKKGTSKTPSNILVTNNLSTNSLVSNNSTDSANGCLNTPTNTSSSLNINLKTEEKIKQYLIKSLDEWCEKMKEIKNKNQQILHLQENVDYEIVIDINANKVLIRCQCGATATLGQKNNNYILSNYIRHLTNRKPCFIVQQKLKNINDITTDNVASTFSNTDASDVDLKTHPTSLEKRKRNHELNALSAKKKKNI
ncbi:unnamed protein product [Rotaria sordida]|uniref:Uncharacterized protein n=1 Tax=Rotaria sordida TaxID=392033 RepID=A0A819QUI2_9BILA|nr:unnamed protein product [Rotaria sordida]